MAVDRLWDGGSPSGCSAAAWLALGGKPNTNAEVVIRVLRGSEGVVPQFRKL